MVPFLSSEFRLISIDLPGFGLTGPVPPKDYSTETSIKTITDVTSLLGLDRFSLAGNSMGGGVAWRYALIHPEKIESLILLASSGIYSNEQREKIRNQDSETPLAWKIMRSNFASFFLSYYTPKFFATQGLRSSVYDSNLATKELSDQFHDLVLLEGSREAILSRFSNFAYQNEIPEILNEIIAPTLIIHGQEDNIIPVISSQNLATYIPNTKLIIYPEIGHLPMYEAPKRVARDIKNFLSNF
jgi:pimeloyl-ACP methyl ester carboxylesterase